MVAFILKVRPDVVTTDLFDLLVVAVNGNSGAQSCKAIKQLWSVGPVARFIEHLLEILTFPTSLLAER